MLKKWWFWLFVILIAVIVVSNNNSPIDNPIVNTLGGNDSNLITLSEFNQIQNGMTYEEVKNIIGSEGTLTAESGNDQYKIAIYSWYGNTLTGANANFTFTNGKLTAKAQVGLSN